MNKKVFRGWARIFAPDNWFAEPSRMNDREECPVTLLRDGPDGERGGLEPWMADPGLLAQHIDEVATAIRNILEAK